MDELLKLLDGLQEWVELHRKDGNTERAKRLQWYIDRLRMIDPEQAEAALLGFKAAFHAYVEDAGRGLDVRHVTKALPGKAPIEEVEKLWQELHDREPDITRNEAIDTLVDSLGCSRRTIEKRLKEGGLTASKK